MSSKNVFMLKLVDFLMCSFFSGGASHYLFHCSKEYLPSSQGLPGPPGEKGENGDVGAMVSVALPVTFLCFRDSHCFHVQPSEVGNCADCSEFLAGG